MKTKNTVLFVLYVTFAHCITYFICGAVFSQLMGYSAWWKQPVICEYFRDFEGGASAAGPFVQIIRGLLFGLVLIPFRDFLREKKYGWLWLWLVFVVIGIIGTPSAAPGSIEGVIYSRLPLVFHFVGLPEICSQTLLFSFLVYRHLNPQEEQKKIRNTILLSFCAAVSVFMVYALVSIVFALLQNVPIGSGSADIAVMGQFLVPVLLVFICSLLRKPGLLLRLVFLYVLSAAAFLIYQGVILHDTGMFFALVAPLFAAGFCYLFVKICDRALKRRENDEDRDRYRQIV